MKKFILILILGIFMSSCGGSFGTKITVMDIETGEIQRINESHKITKVGDTIVVTIHRTGYSFCGMYTGTLPEVSERYKGVIGYRAYKRLK